MWLGLIGMYLATVLYISQCHVCIYKCVSPQRLPHFCGMLYSLLWNCTTFSFEPIRIPNLSASSNLLFLCLISLSRNSFGWQLSVAWPLVRMTWTAYLPVWLTWQSLWSWTSARTVSWSTSPASDEDDMAWCDVTSMVDCFVGGYLEGSVCVGSHWFVLLKWHSHGESGFSEWLMLTFLHLLLSGAASAKHHTITLKDQV